MLNEIRYVLSAEDFERLVSGDVIETKHEELGVLVRVALSDIGWPEMLRLLQKAMREADTKRVDRRVP